jgi:diaminopropionate ammonia-lyase
MDDVPSVPLIEVTVTRNEHAAAAPRMLQRIRAAAPAHTVIRQLPGYAPTPTVWLPGLAQALHVAAVAARDEGWRFGLGSFKSVGAGYAVYRQVASAVAAVTGREPGCTELLTGVHSNITRELLLVCASAGNHGRAVAWAAHLFHCRARVFLSDSVPEERAIAIRAEGGEVVRIAADYDRCVRHVAAEAAMNGWLVISDTAYAGYEDVPIDIMRGYTIIVDEYLREAPLPTHVFVQAGVGGLAAAVAAAFTGRNDDAAPRIIVVEPEHAACIAASMRRGARTEVAHAHSIMGGLACGVASAAAWEALAATDSVSVTIPDSAVAPVSRLLHAGTAGDPPLRAGPSGCAGLAALIGCAANADARASLGIDEHARVLTFVTERG